MNLLTLKHSLENSVWSIGPDDFLTFSNQLHATIKSEAYSTNTNVSDDEDQAIQISNGIAYLPINGIIVKGCGLSEAQCSLLNVIDLDDLNEDLEELRDNPEVHTIILDFDSPGGTVHAHTTALLIQEIGLTKDVIGYCDGKCLSAAYELAAMCSEFYISETAWVGSIGSIYVRQDNTKANEQAGIGYSFITSSPKKVYLNPNVSITAEEQSWIEQAIMYHYDIFKNDVLSNRTISEEYLDASIFIGEQAITPNFADGILNGLGALREKLNKSETQNYL